MPTANTIKKTASENGTKPTGVVESKKSSVALDLYPVGRSTLFRDAVDPKNRLGKYIRSKMHVVDLIPCTFEIPLLKSPTTAIDDAIQSITPQISYNDAIKRFSKRCSSHGLEQKSGVRLHITDETTSSESFDVGYEDSMFQSTLDSLSGKLREIRQYGRSVTEKYDDYADQIAKSAGEATTAGISALFGEGAGANVGKVVGTLADVILKGNRVTMPKIWSNTTHSSELNCFIKLVSPYGTPWAIAEYIIKPIMYLHLLSAPRTKDTVSYGGSTPLTIRAYGLQHMNVGAIKQISFRRGGNDSSFNVYRQPLTVDVRMSFQYLVDGFACFHEDTTIGKNLVKESKTFLSSTEVYEGNSNNAIMSTIRDVVTSLRPIRFSEEENEQSASPLLGYFTKPKQDFPSSLTPIPPGSLMPICPSGGGCSICSSLPSVSVLTKAKESLKQAFPDVEFPEEMTIAETLAYIDAAKEAGLGIYSELQTKLNSLLAIPENAITAFTTLLDTVRQEATDATIELINQLASDLAKTVIENTVSKIPDITITV